MGCMDMPGVYLSAVIRQVPLHGGRVLRRRYGEYRPVNLDFRMRTESCDRRKPRKPATYVGLLSPGYARAMACFRRICYYGKGCLVGARP